MWNYKDIFNTPFSPFLHAFASIFFVSNQNEVKKVFGAKIKIMWEEQIVDPIMHYITSVTQMHHDLQY